uniref:Uncharacterized protein n=1 Tax=Sphaerodactylus townsendi TaxID=933632 RepID=A0ACB8FMU1_9SAUR
MDGRRAGWSLPDTCDKRVLLAPVVGVMQVLNADAIVVKLNSGDYKTVHLSSIRPPRLEGEGTQLKQTVPDRCGPKM